MPDDIEEQAPDEEKRSKGHSKKPDEYTLKLPPGRSEDEPLLIVGGRPVYANEPIQLRPHQVERCKAMGLL